MLDVLSYPVSALMWLWHHLLSLVLDPDSGITWSLSVILLVITVRAVLFVPSVKQFRSMRRSRERQPHRDHATSVLGGCLFALVQIPLFVGLYHVLINFSAGQTVERSVQRSNGVFNAAEVSSFLHARLYGAPLSAYLAMPADALHALGANLGRADIALVALPLVIVAGIATYLTTRHSLGQQADMAGSAAVLSRLVLWVFALLPVLGGVLFPLPIAIALYWVTNNTWTLAQNYLLTRWFAAEDIAPKAAQDAVPRYLAPRPGQKPTRASAKTRRRT